MLQSQEPHSHPETLGWSLQLEWSLPKSLGILPACFQMFLALSWVYQFILIAQTFILSPLSCLHVTPRAHCDCGAVSPELVKGRDSVSLISLSPWGYTGVGAHIRRLSAYSIFTVASSMPSVCGTQRQ